PCPTGPGDNESEHRPVNGDHRCPVALGYYRSAGIGRGSAGSRGRRSHRDCQRTSCCPRPPQAAHTAAWQRPTLALVSLLLKVTGTISTRKLAPRLQPFRTKV